MDLLDLVPVAPAGKKKPPRDDAASAFGSALLPIAQVCLFIWLGEQGFPVLLLPMLPFAAAATSYGISSLLGASAEQRRRSTVSCLVISLMLDFPAFFLVAVSQTF